MTVTIHDLRPKCAHPGDTPNPHPRHSGLILSGAIDKARQNVQVFYELAANGTQSANLPAVSDDRGHWRVEVPGTFAAGTRLTAFARSDGTELASKSFTL